MISILLFRPEHKCQASAQAFAEAGLNVSAVGLIQAVEKEKNTAALSATLSQCKPGSGVVFVSTSAVDFAEKALNGNPLPESLDYYAVGASTAKRLSNLGVSAEIPASQDSEGLLGLDSLANKKQVLIVKGENGRPLLAQKLQERGAEVSHLELYQRVKVKQPNSSKHWQPSAIQCILATSEAMIEAAFDIYDHQWLRSLTWILISDRLVDIANNKGIVNTMRSADASDSALISATKKFMEQQKMAETVDSTQEQTAKTEPAPKSKPPSRIPVFIGVLNLLLLCGLTAGGYYLWLELNKVQQDKAATLLAEREALSELRVAINSRLVEADKQTADSLRQFEQQQTNQLAGLNEAVQSNKQALLEANARRPSDWLLAEANYLLSMAGRKLWLEDDANTALLMLETADERLAQVGDVSLLSVRQLLAEDIQLLKSFTGFSYMDKALKIGALVKSVPTLPLDNLVMPEVPSALEQDELSGEVTDFWPNLKKSFFKIFKVSTLDQGAKPLLDQKEQWLLREQLSLNLQKAQHALLQNHEELFAQQIQQVLNILSFYFHTEDPSVQAFVASVEELSSAPVRPDYPTAFRATNELKDKLAQTQVNQGGEQ